MTSNKTVLTGLAWWAAFVLTLAVAVGYRGAQSVDAVWVEGRPSVTDSIGATYQPCAHEWGQGDGGTYPCVWDADTMGNHLRGAHSPRYTVYARAEEGCPVVSDVDEQCVYAVEWSADKGD
jgi:hypothetical protein